MMGKTVPRIYTPPLRELTEETSLGFACAEYAEEDPHSEIVLNGDAPCVYASVDVILKWINEGKPRITDWMQSTNAIYYM